MLDNYPDVLSFRQVMEITHVGRNLLLRLLNSGEIPAFKMGKLWKVYKQDLRSRNPAGFNLIDF